MYWDNSGQGADHVLLARNGFIRTIGLEHLPAGLESQPITANTFVEEERLIVFNNEAFSLIQFYDIELIQFNSTASMSAENSRQLASDIGTIDTITTVSAEIDRIIGGELRFETPSGLTTLAEPDKSLKPSPIQVIQTASYLYYATATVVVRYSKADFSIDSFVTSTGITSICISDTALYLGNSSGVYQVTLANLDLGGDQTSQLALKFSTATSPALQANAVTCLGASGVSILVGNTSGVDFIVDETTTTVYTLTAANVTDCAISGFYISYIVAGLAYSRALPNANFTLVDSDMSAVQPNVATNVTNMTTNVISSIYLPRPKGCATGDAGETTHLLCIDQFDLELYKINPDNTFTLVDSLTPGGSYDVRGVHGDYYFGCTDGGYQHLYLWKRVGDTIQFMDDIATTNNVSLETDQIKFNSDATVIKCAISAGASDGTNSWRIHQLFTRSGDTLGWTGQNWEYDNMTTKCGFSDPNGYTISPGCYNSLNQQAEDSYILFNSGLQDLHMYYPQIALGQPAWVNGTMFVAIEQGISPDYDQWLCLYEVVSNQIVARDAVNLHQGNILGGNNPLGVPQTETHRYDLEVVNGTIILFHRQTWFGGWPGNYNGSLQTEFYTVAGATLNPVQGSLTFAANGWVTYVDNVFKIFGTRWICKISDFDNATGVTTYRYNIFDFDNASSPAYSTANCLAAETSVFVGTDGGIFIENPADKSTLKLGEAELGSNTNVKSIEVSAGADKVTGFLTYGVDDEAGSAKHGYIDLEA